MSNTNQTPIDNKLKNIDKKYYATEISEYFHDVKVSSAFSEYFPSLIIHVLLLSMFVFFLATSKTEVFVVRRFFV